MGSKNFGVFFGFFEDGCNFFVGFWHLYYIGGSWDGKR